MNPHAEIPYIMDRVQMQRYVKYLKPYLRFWIGDLVCLISDLKQKQVYHIEHVEGDIEAGYDYKIVGQTFAKSYPEKVLMTKLISLHIKDQNLVTYEKELEL